MSGSPRGGGSYCGTVSQDVSWTYPWKYLSVSEVMYHVTKNGDQERKIARKYSGKYQEADEICC